MTKHTSLMQFSLWAILISLAAVSVLCAISVPILHSWNEERRLKFLWLSASSIAGAVAAAIFMFFCRYRAEQLGGGRLITLPFGSWWTKTAASWGIALFSGVILFPSLYFNSGTFLSSMPLDSKVRLFANVSQFGFSFCFATMLAMGTINTWFRTMCSVELCENGVVVNGIRYYAWSTIRSVKWHIEKGKLELETGWSTTCLNVPLKHRERVDQIIRECSHVSGCCPYQKLHP